MGRSNRTGAIPHRQYIRYTRSDRVRYRDSVLGEFLTRNAFRLYSNVFGVLSNMRKLGQFYPEEIEALEGPRDGATAYAALPGPGTTVTTLGPLIRVENASATFITDGFVDGAFAVIRITSVLLGEVLLYSGTIQPGTTETQMDIFLVPSSPYQGEFDGVEGSLLEVLVA